MKSIQQFRSRTILFCCFAVLTSGFIGNAVAQAQTCPHQLLFSYGDVYYYNGKNCATGQIIDELYSFLGPIATGCGPNGECATAASPYTMLIMPMVVGDPPGDEADIRPVPPETSLMVPFGNSRISMLGGYPKFVKGQINNADRFFKVYHVAYTDDAGRRHDLRIGMEVTEVPAGQAVVNASQSDVVGKRVKLTIDVGFGRTGLFEALYKTQQ